MDLQPLDIGIALAAGAALGAVYFGLLWLTVRAIPRSKSPAALVFGSLLGRLALALGVFYFVMDGRWERLLVCLAGFLIVRQVMIVRVRPHESPGGVGRKGEPA
jgi:F1F0 ATPase subunit 2